MSLEYTGGSLFENSELTAGLNTADNTWEVIVKYSGDLSRVETELNADVELLSESYAIITLDAGLIDTLSRYSEIEHIEKPKNLLFSLRDALGRACIAVVQDSSGFGLTGKGVIVAVADSGIDYTHPDFRNTDGTSRILYIWDQTARGPGSPPAGFKHGVEYTNEQLNAALANRQPFSVIPELDTVGHGTAVAGVAAGNGRAGGGVNVGAAPEASIIAVRLGRTGERSFIRNTELMRAIKYFQDKAQALNMPLAINISYGTSNGSHDGQSLFETYIDDMASKWKTNIIVAAGNEGASSHHFSGSASSYSNQDVDFYTSGGLQSFFFTFWQNFTDEFYLELILPDGQSTGQISYVSPIRSMRFGNTAVYAEYSQPTHYNENQEIFFQIRALNGYLPQGLWKIRVTTGVTVEGTFDIWLPVTEEVGAGTAFTRPDPLTTITLPATSGRAISVGGYNYRLGALAGFSGQGYTRSGDIKPDILAPAVDIMAPRKGGGYDAFTGTSIAAPFVTGAVALMMQWGIVQGNDPYLYGQRVKAFLKSGAERLQTNTYPSPGWGYGTLCLRATMEEMMKYLTL